VVLVAAALDSVLGQGSVLIGVIRVMRNLIGREKPLSLSACADRYRS
jgi:hypothetical protein